MTGVDYGSINEPGKSRQSFSPPSPNEPPQAPDVPPPAISAIEPSTCAIGDVDFTLDVTGTGFLDGSVINFAGNDEPTTFNPPDTLSTLVKPSLWTAPVTVQCLVKTGPLQSTPVDFVFTDAIPPEKLAAMDADELEDEIEQEIEEGDIEPVHHRGKPTKTLPHKRKK